MLGEVAAGQGERNKLCIEITWKLPSRMFILLGALMALKIS